MKRTNTNLSVVLLDEDVNALLHIEQLITTTQIANVIGTYTDSEKFIKDLPILNFDLLILDIEIQGISGKTLIKKVGKERCIVNTASEHRYAEAIKSHPIDILIKPAKRAQVLRALEKALIFIPKEEEVAIEYQMFNVAEDKYKKTLIKLSDILYVRSSPVSPRNKEIALRSGTKFTLLDYSFKELLKIAPKLIQINQSEAVSIEIIQSKGFDEIIVKELPGRAGVKSLTLSRAFRIEFNKRIA